MLKPVHARMARAALQWSLRDLQEKTGINKNTLARFESGRGVLLSTAVKIEDVFKRGGIEFIYEDEDERSGVMVTKGVSSRADIGIGTVARPRARKRGSKKK